MEDKVTQWRNILPPWQGFFEKAPLSSTIEEFKTEKGKMLLENLLHDVMTFDDSPCYVAWDMKNNKVVFLFNIF